MNPDSPIDPRSALESSLTALLLGELPHEQAAALHQKLAQDAELAALYERLKHTINLVRETVSSPAQETADQPAPLKLSEERRQKLLQQFKTVAPREFARPRRRPIPWLVPIGLAAAFLLILGAITLPTLSRRTGEPTLGFHTWSLKDTFSPAQSQLAAGTKTTDEDRSRNERSERFAGRPVTPIAVPPPALVASAGTAIVLPKESAPDTAASASRSRYGPLPEPAPVEPGAPTKAAPGTSGEAGGSEVRVFRLANADASETANQFAQLFPKPTAPTSGGQGPTTSFSFFRGGFGGQAGNTTAAADGNDQMNKVGRPLAVADPRTSSLIVTAPKTLMPQIADMIAELDANQGRKEVIGYYDIRNADVADVYNNLQDLFQRSNVRQQNNNQNPTSGQNSPLYRHETGTAQSTSGNSSRAAPVESQQPGMATSDSFFSRPKAVGALETARQVKNDGQIQALGKPALFVTFAGPPVVAFGTGSRVAGEAVPATPPPIQGEATFADRLDKITQPASSAVVGLSSHQPPPPPAAAPALESAGAFAFQPAATANNIALPAPVLTPSAGVAAGGAIEVAKMPTETHSEVLAGVPLSSLTAVPSRPSAEPTKGAELLKERHVAEASRVEASPAQKTAVNEAALRQANVVLAAQGGTAPVQAGRRMPEAKAHDIPLDGVELAWSDSLQHQKQGGFGVGDSSAQGFSLDLNRNLPQPLFAGGKFELSADQKSAKAPSPEGDVTHLYAAPPAWSPETGYQWYAANKGLPVSSNSDADRVPMLGDVPALGRLYRLKEDEVGGGLKVKDEEKVNSVELADAAYQEGRKTTPGFGGSGPSNIYSQKGADYYNLTAGSNQQILVANQLSTAGNTILKDTSGADQRSRQLLEEKQELGESQTAKAKQTNQSDVAPAKPSAPVSIPQPEIQTSDNAFSTFSLNVSDVSFKLAAASLEKGVMPEPGTVRSEEFINAFDYRDPEPPSGVAVGFAWERAQYPFAQNRDLLRFSIKTAAQGRQPGRPMNIVLLLDTSGSMERADRVQIIREALRVLAGQLQPQDKFSVVTFARTARLWVDGVPGNQTAQVAEEVGGITPQGGTNLEDAMTLAYQTAQRHYLANGVNRVVLLTDGAANLGDVDPETLKQKVEANRKQGIALDCFGIGWEGYNDDLLEVLSRNGDGRYGFINTPEEAATGFAAQLAGALQVAASDVKVQVEFNPARVTAYRQIGYAKHQLTKEQFRDKTVAAAQIGAAESGNALYVIAVNPVGDGPLATVRVRYRVPGTSEVHEHEWPVPYTGNAAPLDQSSPAMRLAATASAFSEWLVSSPYATEVTPDRLLGYLNSVPDVYGADLRPKKLEWMIRQAKSIAGR